MPLRTEEWMETGSLRKLLRRQRRDIGGKTEEEEAVWLLGVVTVDRVLRARGKMMKNKANGPSDLVTEMPQNLPMEAVDEVTHGRKAVQGSVQRLGESYDWCSLKNQTPNLKNDVADSVRLHW